MAENIFKNSRDYSKQKKSSKKIERFGAKELNEFEKRQLASFELKFDDMLYTPAGVRNFDIFDLRREYSRIRSIVKKRAGRLEQKGINNYVTRYAKELPGVVGQTRDELEQNLIFAVELYGQPTLVDYSYANRAVNELSDYLGSELGVDGLNDIRLDKYGGEISVVGEFWRILKEYLPLSMIDSPRTQRAFNEMIEDSGYANRDDQLKTLVTMFRDFLTVELGRNWRENL